MTNTDKLMNYIVRSNYTLNTIAKILQISKTCLISKINGEKEFKAEEIIEIAKILEMNKAEMLYIFLIGSRQFIYKERGNGMKESKYELKNWKRWKHTLYLLKKTREELNDKKIIIDDEHQEINKMMQDIVSKIEHYDLIIYNYEFFIKRLEEAINKILTNEEKTCVLIYANEPDNAAKREYTALEKGISRTVYYKTLSNACNKLDKVLAPFNDQDLNNYICKKSIEL